MQNIFVIYDIQCDRARTKIAMTCQDYGLDRIQFSAFYGRLSRNHQQQLMMEIRDLLGDGAGNIQLIPVCEQDWKKRIEVSHA